MKLPGGDNAIVEIAKLRDYCLDPQHPRGRHKARVFSALGLGQSDADFLRATLLKAALEADAVPGEADEYGDRYTIDLLIVGIAGRRPERLDRSSGRDGAEADELFCTIRMKVRDARTRTTLGGGFAGRQRTVSYCVARSVRSSNDLPPMCTKSSSAMTRAGLTPLWHCVPTSCFSFITSRAIRRLDHLDPDFSCVRIIDNPPDPFLDGGGLLFR